MSEQHDRLAAIKARRDVEPAALLEEDADWLIAEVERLRAVLVELRAYVRLYTLVEQVCAGTITPEQTLAELQTLKQRPGESSTSWLERLHSILGGEEENREQSAVIHDLDARRSLSRFLRGRG